MDTPDCTTKTCSKCNIKYPATNEYFNHDRQKSDGLRPDCKICQSKRARGYYKKRRHERCEYQRRYGIAHAQSIKEYKQVWKALHPEYHRNYMKWYSATPKRIAYLTKYRIENPEKRRISARNYRARKLAAEGKHTAADIEAQFKRQKGKCYYCGCKMIKTPHKPNSTTVDHVVPLDRGGRNSPDNLVIACLHCNTSKNNKLPHEWIEGGRLI